MGRVRHNRRNVIRSYVWEWNDQSQFKRYDQSDEIEQAYQLYTSHRGPSTFQISQTGSMTQTYTLNFKRMRQRNSRTGYERMLRRREIVTQVGDLFVFFSKYASSSPDGCEDSESGSISALHGDDIMKLCSDCGIDPTDPNLLVLFYRIGCEQKYVITKEEFLNLAKIRILNKSQFISSIKHQLTYVRSNPDEMKKFYDWLFTYFKTSAESRVIDQEMAIECWKIIFGKVRHPKWKFLNDWIEYIQSKRHSITHDQWKMVFDFAEGHGTLRQVLGFDLGASCWPCLIDEFVEALRQKKKTTTTRRGGRRGRRRGRREEDEDFEDLEEEEDVIIVD